MSHKFPALNPEFLKIYTQTQNREPCWNLNPAS